MPFIESAHHTSLFVTDWGSGPPVVFTHAWGLQSDQWNYQVPALTEAGLWCVRYDRRGHGRSDRPPLRVKPGDSIRDGPGRALGAQLAGWPVPCSAS
jgi:pimeloyl-ACP methyl ester carboxylesterase